MKKCNKCNQEKDLSEFSWKSKPKGIKQAKCKACYRELRNKWYQDHKEDEVKTAKKYIYKRRKEIKEWFNNLKSKSECAHCGETKPPVLQFHHLDPSEKDINIGEAVHIGWSLKRIELEIAKCIVLCANCHILEHVKLRTKTKRKHK